MSKITIYHDDYCDEIVVKINRQLEFFGLIIDDVSEEGADFMEYQIKVIEPYIVNETEADDNDEFDDTLNPNAQ